ncbi:axial regulator YABBY 4 [Coffea arabica]|uniref:Axial regulator YABBY 4 n=1 Tax=Coffea arabica TaxID=13443 RepID=A0A6P6V9W4_COFAR
MTTLNHLLDLQGQICYVQCGYCTTILLVNVPYSSLSAVVTVRCGHCTSLLSVNMTRASFLPLHLFAPFDQSDQSTTQVCPQETDVNADDHKGLDMQIPSHVVSSPDEEEGETQAINKPPEKRQRAPSAYNRFIGEEIQRLKAINPTMTHKQAFSRAAKSWAHLPLGLQKEGESQAGKDDDASFQSSRGFKTTP